MEYATSEYEVYDAVEDDVLDDGDLVGYSRPAAIVDDQTLTLDRKRHLLAYWASDIHAVAGAPGLRSARGVTVPVDDILDALKLLDTQVEVPVIEPSDHRAHV